MFQNFKSSASPEFGAGRIKSLREQMREHGLDAYLVPHGDEHQNEYLPRCAERLSWLTGFTGSAGFCIVTLEKAVLFVDGRYTLQAAQQTDPSVFEIGDLVNSPPSQWLAENMEFDQRIGHDPGLTTMRERDRFEASAEKASARLIDTANLVDMIWTERPPAPQGAISVHDLVHSGETAKAKKKRLDEKLAEKEADLCLLSDPASLAWVFNIRGSDIAHTPVPLGYALLRRGETPFLFIDPAKLDEAARTHLGKIALIEAPESLEAVLRREAAEKSVLCDPDRVTSLHADIIEDAGGKVLRARDPVVLMRAVKNEAEIAGSRAAHLRDGVAVTRFLAWLDRAEPGSVDEISAATELETCRRDTAQRMNSELREISFDTISGAGANGAIVHYRVTEESNARLEPDSLYLVDSGGQYEDGTTDITRTVPIGTPPKGAAEDFTLVLKGHIAIATAKFPEKTRGIDIDCLARIALWRTGRDYAHGTGHGVGSFLSVHEGPQGISRRAMEPLLSGMILSNEPGLYREGRYGIRIENLVLVKPAQEMPDGTIKVHEFETITLAPIDRRLVLPELMTREELAWLDAYHARVCSELSPWLDDEDRGWLENATRPLSR